MNTSICPKCKTKLERNPIQEGNLLKYMGICACGYFADVTGDILRESQEKSFSEEKLKQFLVTCPKPGLNETIRRTYSELKEIMKTDNEELADEILIKYINLKKIDKVGLLGQRVAIFVIHPNN